MDTLYNEMKTKLFFIIGTNVIESEEHTMKIANHVLELQEKYKKQNIIFIFKICFQRRYRKKWQPKQQSVCSRKKSRTKSLF